MREANFFCFIVNLCVTFLVGAILPLLPALTRKSFLFGVKIPLEEQGCREAKAMKNQYVTVCLIGAVVILALVVAQYAVFPELSLIGSLYFPLLFAAVQMLGFIPNWKKAVALKAAQGWHTTDSVFADTQSSHSRGTLADLPWAWYVLSLIILCVSVLIVLVRYPHLPDAIPTHFDFNMRPDVWSDKSPLTIMTMPLFGLGTLLMMWLIGVTLVRTKLQIDPQNPALSFAQHRIYRRRMGNSAGFMTLGVIAGLMLIDLMPIWPEVDIPFWLIMAIEFVPMIPLVVVAVASGQGGCRIKPKTVSEKMVAKTYGPASPGSAFRRGDDKYWALGLFYHNPDDPAYLVEDRFGNNFGFNYSRLPVKIGVAISLLAFIAMYVWATIVLWPGLQI